MRVRGAVREVRAREDALEREARGSGASASRARCYARSGRARRPRGPGEGSKIRGARRDIRARARGPAACSRIARFTRMTEDATRTRTRIARRRRLGHQKRKNAPVVGGDARCPLVLASRDVQRRLDRLTRALRRSEASPARRAPGVRKLAQARTPVRDAAPRVRTTRREGFATRRRARAGSRGGAARERRSRSPRPGHISRRRRRQRRRRG